MCLSRAWHTEKPTFELSFAQLGPKAPLHSQPQESKGLKGRKPWKWGGPLLSKNKWAWINIKQLGYGPQVLVQVSIYQCKPFWVPSFSIVVGKHVFFVLHFLLFVVEGC